MCSATRSSKCNRGRVGGGERKGGVGVTQQDEGRKSTVEKEGRNKEEVERKKG